MEITQTLGHKDVSHIYLAYIADPSQEHYDSCIPVQYPQQAIEGEQHGRHNDGANDCHETQNERSPQKTPSKDYPQMNLTPRKNAT